MGLFADYMLADAILIHPRPPITALHYKEGKGSSKKYGNKYQKNHLLVKENGDVGMANRFSKKYGNKG